LDRPHHEQRVTRRTQTMAGTHCAVPSHKRSETDSPVPSPRRLETSPTIEARAAWALLPSWAEQWGVEAIVQRLLLEFAGQLDVWLCQPLWVEAAPGLRRTVLFDFAPFAVHFDAIGTPLAMSSGLGHDIQLWPFLSRADWRCVLMAALESCECGELAQVLPRLRQRIRQWIVATCQRLLATDARFRRVREVDAIKAFGFEPDLIAIALRARIPSESPALTWSHFQEVCEHARAFRQVARENPRLLCLVTAALQEGIIDARADAISILANHVKEAVSPKAWRYLARHGPRMLYSFWQLGIPLPMETAIEYLRILGSTGWPPPPPRRLVRAWLRRAEDDLYGCYEAQERWLKPHVLGCASRLADATKAQPVSMPSEAEFLRVAEWASQHLPSMNKLQRASGWRWLERQCRQHEQHEQNVGEGEADCWSSRVGPILYSGWLIEPLLTTCGVIEVKLALRNCLDTLLDGVRHNRIRLFGIREADTRKIVGAIGIHIDPDDADQWSVLEVKGVANRRTPHWAPIAELVARRYSQADEERVAHAFQLTLDLGIPDEDQIVRVDASPRCEPAQGKEWSDEFDIPF
jgi:hypothetical protein